MYLFVTSYRIFLVKCGMEYLDPTLFDFEKISLEELELVQLLNRRDTKFVFNQSKLPAILNALMPHFRLLEINNHRIIGYQNIYFDTDDLLFYTQHHNEKLNRFKVRMRRYLQPDASYFEIKLKTNKKRMIKRRIKVPQMSEHLSGPAKELIQKVVGIPPEILSPKLWIQFSRITLVDKNFKSRVTMDSNIKVKNSQSEGYFNHLIVVELKQDNFRPVPEFFQAMRIEGVYKMRISKYCMGILYTYDGVKYNRFKQKALRINKLMSENMTEGNDAKYDESRGFYV